MDCRLFHADLLSTEPSEKTLREMWIKIQAFLFIDENPIQNVVYEMATILLSQDSMCYMYLALK